MYVDDETRLRHMLDAANEITEYTRAHQRSDVDENQMLFHSLKDCFATIGEAAFKISHNFKNSHPEIDWRGLVDFRNEMVHDYFSIDRDILWNTAVFSIPWLIIQLQQVNESKLSQ